MKSMSLFSLSLLALGIILIQHVSGKKIQWQSFQNRELYVDFAMSYTVKQTWNVQSLGQCQKACVHECDYVIYDQSKKTCQERVTDKTDGKKTFFKNSKRSIGGEIRGLTPTKSINVNGGNADKKCMNECNSNENCHFAILNKKTTRCYHYKLKYRGQSILSYRKTPAKKNANKNKLGSIKVIGNSGVVAIHASLLPTGKVVFTARPEYKRGGANPDNISRKKEVPYGEIAAIFDPISGKHVPSELDENIFCHAQILMEDGNSLSVGGDSGGDPGRPGDIGNGLAGIRIYNTDNGKWSFIEPMQKTRWYPSVIRTSNEKFMIIGGQKTGGAYVMQDSIEIYDPKQSGTLLKYSPLIASSWATNYPKMSNIPGSGNIFILANRLWAVVDKDTGNEKQLNTDWGLLEGQLTGGRPAASVVIPMTMNKDGGVSVARALFAGGGDDQLFGMKTVHSINIMNPNSGWQKDENMPYGRIGGDAVIQPNLQICVFNGWHYGNQGGDIGVPSGFPQISEVFCYNKDKPWGKKWKIYQKTDIRRLYHATAVLVPDGRTLIQGTDQATYEEETSYEHRVEAFIPPWNMGKTRPVIHMSPSKIQFGSTFKISYYGTTVSMVSMLAPGAASHGTEFSQRAIELYIVSKTDTYIELRAPKDSTVMLSGYHLLFICKGNVCSEGKWIQNTRGAGDNSSINEKTWDCSNLPKYKKQKKYKTGAEVTFENKKYTANKNSKRKSPGGNRKEWQKQGKCRK